MHSAMRVPKRSRQAPHVHARTRIQHLHLTRDSKIQQSTRAEEPFFRITGHERRRMPINIMLQRFCLEWLRCFCRRYIKSCCSEVRKVPQCVASHRLQDKRLMFLFGGLRGREVDTRSTAVYLGIRMSQPMAKAVPLQNREHALPVAMCGCEASSISCPAWSPSLLRRHWCGMLGGHRQIGSVPRPRS